MKKVMRMVKIKKAEYVLSAAWKSQWPEESFPEMCLAGRSNVGKSSFINAMLNHNGLAKVSGTPGKTRTLNFFNVNDALYFVDVPGYGYAKVNDSITKQFGKTMDEYITLRSTLRGFILLVDYRHKPTKDDVLMYEFVKHHDTLGFHPEDKFVRFSSLRKKGIEEAWNFIYELCDINFN